MEILHYPVMHQEVLDNLVVPDEEGRVLIDCTTGEGGHSALFLSKYRNLNVIGLDRDSEIQKKAIERFKDYKDRFQPVNTWFDDYLALRESESADLILFDLGISIFHYEESRRGFSFRADEVLDMRLDSNQKNSARTARKEKAIETASELANIISRSVPKEYRYGRISPSTRTFQALRIEVNHELDRISPALENAVRVLRPGGRIGVITFHSLEDRIVKWFFKERAAKENSDIRIITKKPIVPTEAEEKENSPSRSAKLRIVEKI